MKKHNEKGQRIAQHLEGLGYFNTADLNSIGQAFYDTFEEEDIDAEAIVEHVGATWPEDADDDDKTKKIDLDDWFWKHEAGAVLVRELADQGFKIVRKWCPGDQRQ